MHQKIHEKKVAVQMIGEFSRHTLAHVPFNDIRIATITVTIFSLSCFFFAGLFVSYRKLEWKGVIAKMHIQIAHTRNST